MAIGYSRLSVRLLAICGLLAPFVYSAAALAAGAGNPGYSQSTQFVSELGATGAPTAWSSSAPSAAARLRAWPAA